MTALLASIAARYGLPKWVVVLVASLALLALVAGAAGLWLADVKRDAIRDDRASGNVEAARTETRVKEQAATERLNDERAVAKLEKDLNDATKHLPDTVPTPRRIARACAQLRAQGTDTASIPQCSGLAP